MTRLLAILSVLHFGYLHSIAQGTDTLKNQRLSIHAQATVIYQYKPSFTAKYTGDNSLKTTEENQTSITSTLYFGARLWKGASIFVNPEVAGGSGLSGALGIAAATNGETFRIGDPAPKIYLARLYFTQMFALTSERVYQETDFNQLGGYIPSKYFAITAGKIGIADFFDDNEFSHDPRTQFMSWALMSNGAWDYPANTRGYTPSLVLEYVSPKHELRYGISLMPETANGNVMNWTISKSSSQTLEYTHRHKLGGYDGALRLLGFFTRTGMGSYRESIAMSPQSPDITATRKEGRTKYGFGINADQYLSKDFGVFFKASWNDGNNETWAFTEIDRSMSAGVTLSGNRWKRPNDNIGLAYVASGISSPHRDYLKAGGNGFILGDGDLNYTLEHLAELYYSTELLKDHIYLSGVYQFLMNPGYNEDRHGPVHVFSVRFHARM